MLPTYLALPPIASSHLSYLQFLLSCFVLSVQITSSIRDTSVNGLEGLNIKVAAPFRFQDYVFGFKYSLSDLKNAPEQLFAKRSFDTTAGTFTVDTDYTISNHNVGMAAKWSHEPLGLSVGLNGDTQSKLKNVGVSQSLTF